MLTDHKSSISTQRGYHISDQGHSDPYQGGNDGGSVLQTMVEAVYQGQVQKDSSGHKYSVILGSGGLPKQAQNITS